MALHTPSNYKDDNYQRFIRIFSLQLRKQPIQITIKDMFTFNFTLLKSVCMLPHFRHPYRVCLLINQFYSFGFPDNSTNNKLRGHCYPISNIRRKCAGTFKETHLKWIETLCSIIIFSFIKKILFPFFHCIFHAQATS